MIYPEYKREMDRIQMLLPDRCPDENDYQYEMILHNQIQGMIPVKKQFSNGISSYCYDISNKQSLTKCYDGVEMNYEQIRTLLIATHIILGRLREYLLDENCILIHPDYIYMDANRKQVFWVFYPCAEDGILCMDGMRALSDFLISHTNHSDNAAVTVVYALFKESRNENFTLQSVMNLLEELDQTEEEKAVPDVVDADDGVQPREEETDHVANSSDGQARKKEKGKMILLTMLCLAGLFFLSGYICLYQDGSAGLKDYMMGVCVLSVPALGWFHYHERFH